MYHSPTTSITFCCSAAALLQMPNQHGKIVAFSIVGGVMICKIFDDSGRKWLHNQPRHLNFHGGAICAKHCNKIVNIWFNSIRGFWCPRFIWHRVVVDIQHVQLSPPRALPFVPLVDSCNLRILPSKERLSQRQRGLSPVGVMGRLDQFHAAAEIARCGKGCHCRC